MEVGWGLEKQLHLCLPLHYPNQNAYPSCNLVLWANRWNASLIFSTGFRVTPYNCTPPAPLSQDLVQYLMLALDT